MPWNREIVRLIVIAVGCASGCLVFAFVCWGMTTGARLNPLIISVICSRRDKKRGCGETVKKEGGGEEVLLRFANKYAARLPDWNLIAPSKLSSLSLSFSVHVFDDVSPTVFMPGAVHYRVNAAFFPHGSDHFFCTFAISCLKTVEGH